MSRLRPTFILTDIEGTTTSISFVTDELFPYFRQHISELVNLKNNPVVKEAFAETIRLAKEEDHLTISTDEEILETLNRWSIEDRKITPLKTLQGVLWDFGYKNGSLKGHVYADVAPALARWQANGIEMGVFSSGSVAAQKLIFGYSIAGDLTPFFKAYFDTNTGGKRETETYSIIAKELKIAASDILFLSDIREELEAAKEAGLQTVQLVRPGGNASWERQVSSFDELRFD